MPTEIVNLAITDLWKLLDIENDFYRSKDYQDIFWKICNGDIKSVRLSRPYNKSNRDNIKEIIVFIGYI